MDSNEVNPLAKKVERILNFSLDQETLNALSNVSNLIDENNLNNRRNLRAKIEKQSLLVNEEFVRNFEQTYANFQKLYSHVGSINESCNRMIERVEELRLQTSDFLKETSDVNLELQKLQNNEKVLATFFEEFQLSSSELSLISNAQNGSNINDNFFQVLANIKTIYEKAKTLLVANQDMTGFEIMELMSKYEEMANDNLYRWTIRMLRTISADMLELQQPHLFRSIGYLQSKDVLFKHCLDEYTTVRRSSFSHSFIEALTRGRTNSSNVNQPAMELYSHDILRYIRDMFSFLHQAIVLEKDMLAILLKQCNQEELKKDQTIENILSSITDGVARPLKIRIENSLISSNKNLAVTSRNQPSQVEKTINYFLAKNIINFYVQTLGSLISNDSSLLYTIKELLILSDKVFYNSLNYYCSTNIERKFESSLNVQPQSQQTKMSLNATEHLNEFIHLLDELLKYIKSSPILNEAEHRLETQRIVSAAFDPYMQYVIIYSSRLSSIEMTVFTFNCLQSLCDSIGKFNYTEDFVTNLRKQIDENIEILVNEQFQHLISMLSASSLYNACLESLGNVTPLSSLSGCDALAVNTFLSNWNKFIDSPEELKIPQLDKVIDSNARNKIWLEALKLACEAYEKIHKALLDANNRYDDILSLINYKPEEVKHKLLS